MSPAFKALDCWKQSLKMSTITYRIMHKLAGSEQGKLRGDTGAVNVTSLGAVGGGLLSGGLMAGAKGVAEEKLLDQGKAVPTGGVLKKLRKFEGAAKLPVTSVPFEGASAYVPKQPGYAKKVVNTFNPTLGKLMEKEQLLLPNRANPFITAHEVGHASGGRAAKALMKHRMPITALSSLGGLGLLGHAAYTAEKGEGMGATGYAAPAVAAVAPALVQGEELRATLKARKLLNKAKIKVPGLGKLMGAQQLNYLLGNLGKVAPVGVGALALHHYLKPKDEGN